MVLPRNGLGIILFSIFISDVDENRECIHTKFVGSIELDKTVICFSFSIRRFYNDLRRLQPISDDIQQG